MGVRDSVMLPFQSVNSFTPKPSHRTSPHVLDPTQLDIFLLLVRLEANDFITPV